MSLSSYLTKYEPTRRIFGALPDLKGEFHTIARYRKRGTPLRVPRTAVEPTVVGTAFDYWLRAWLARTWPGVSRQEGHWVAEIGFDGLPQFFFDTPETDAIDRRLREVREIYSAYTAGGEKLLGDFLRGCLFLARLDPVYRAVVDEPDYFRFNKQDLDDLSALTALTMQRRYLFTPRERMIFNPTFGEMSHVVTGADADLVIDDLLIDIKVSAQARRPRSTYQRQLIGYWILAAMQGEPWPIRRLGIYLAREGILYTLPVATLVQRVDVPALARAFLAEVATVKAGDQRQGQAYLETLAPHFDRLQIAVDSLRSSPW